MSKVTTVFCDVCGAKDAVTREFYVDRRMDPAGSMEDEHEYLDLCGNCGWKAYTLAQRKHGRELGKDVHTELSGLAAKFRQKDKAA